MSDIIEPLRFFNVQKVLPAVYGDELSYYELLAKMEQKINEEVGSINDQNVKLALMQKAIEDFTAGGYKDDFEQFLDTWFAENMDTIDQYLEEGFSGELDEIRESITTSQEQTLNTVADEYVPFPIASASKYGTDGQVLRTNGDGTTLWQAPLIPTDQQAETYINAWLNAHPEATTTVEDGSLTTAKYANNSITDEKLVQSGGVLDTVDSINDALAGDNKTFTISATGTNRFPYRLLRGIKYTYTNNTGGTQTLYKFDAENNPVPIGNGTLAAWASVTFIPDDDYFKIGGYFNQTGTAEIETRGIVENIEELTDFTEYQRNVNSRISVISKEPYTELNSDFVAGRGYYGGARGDDPSQNYWQPRPARATAVFHASVGSIIKFDHTKCLINYFVVAHGNIHYFISTPNVWHNSDEIVTKVDNQYKYVSDTDIIVMFRKPDDTTITSAELNNIVPYITVYNDNSVVPIEKADVLIFSGQSNIAGRGITNASHPETAPMVKYGTAFEYRAITDPDSLYPLDNNFGKNENKTGYIDDGTKKTGSLVPAFVNAYRANNGNPYPLICVSASEGGTSISSWKTNKVIDACERLTACLNYLSTNNIRVRNIYLVWCQGESDGDNRTTKADYISDFNDVMTAFKNVGVEKCLMVRIGNINVSPYLLYKDMIEWQTEIAQTNPFVCMISTDFASMQEREMMKDSFHYYQDGYNECGKYAGINAGIFASSGKEMTMYDPEYDNLYYSHKN